MLGKVSLQQEIFDLHYVQQCVVIETKSLKPVYFTRWFNLLLDSLRKKNINTWDTNAKFGLKKHDWSEAATKSNNHKVKLLQVGNILWISVVLSKFLVMRIPLNTCLLAQSHTKMLPSTSSMEICFVDSFPSLLCLLWWATNHWGG